MKLTSFICLAMFVVLGVAQCTRAQPAKAYKILVIHPERQPPLRTA